MLNQDRLIVKIGRNRSGFDAGDIDMEVAHKYVQELSDQDFEELLDTLDAARISCIRARENANKSCKS